MTREKETEMVEIYASCKLDTEDAILVEIEDGDYWIPKSQIDNDSDVLEDGDAGRLIIPEWIVIDKGLI